MEAAIIIKLLTVGADLVSNGLKAYDAHKDEFSSDDQKAIRQAIATVRAINDAKEDTALATLDAAARS
jgi:hypothetical protein